MKKPILLLLSSLLCIVVFAQKEVVFKSSLSSDTILAGNAFELRYIIENAETVQFIAPELEDFQVIAGPNTSSRMSMMNGVVTRSMTYSYYLQPLEEGNALIPSASIELPNDLLTSDPMLIVVMPNPEGIIEIPKGEQEDLFFDSNPFDHPFFRSPFEATPPPKTAPVAKKKKRKITKV